MNFELCLKKKKYRKKSFSSETMHNLTEMSIIFASAQIVLCIAIASVCVCVCVCRYGNILYHFAHLNVDQVMFIDVYWNAIFSISLRIFYQKFYKNFPRVAVYQTYKFYPSCWFSLVAIATKICKQMSYNIKKKQKTTPQKL